MPSVLTLYSSARPDGHTFQMVQALNQLLPGESCYLDELNIAQYDYQFRNQEDDFIAVINKMLDADTIVFASPVYWYSLTPAFRRFFDRFTDLTELPALKGKGKQLRQKCFYLLATSASQHPPDSFVFPVEQTMQYLGWPFKGTTHLDCGDGFDSQRAIALLQPLVAQAAGNK